MSLILVGTDNSLGSRALSASRQLICEKGVNGRDCEQLDGGGIVLYFYMAEPREGGPHCCASDNTRTTYTHTHTSMTDRKRMKWSWWRDSGQTYGIILSTHPSIHPFIHTHIFLAIVHLGRICTKGRDWTGLD